MALVRLLGVEHLPSGVGVGTPYTCYGLTQADLGAVATWNGDLANYPQVGHLRVEGGILQYGGRKETMPAHGAGLASLSLNKLMGPIEPNKLIIGFRCSRMVVPEAAVPIFALDTNPVGSGSTAGTPTNQLLVHQVADPLTSNYYEFVFDFTTGKYDVYRDNAIFVSQSAIPAAITKTTIKNYYWEMGRYDVYTIPPGTDIKVFQFSDIYIVADLGTAGDTDVNRLGPITVRKANVISNTGNGWTSTPGLTVPEALNSRREFGKITTPYAVAPADRTPLRLKFKNSDLAGAVIKGLYVGASAFRDSGVTDGLNAKVSYNNADSTAATLANLDTTTPLDQRVFSGTKAPDGTKLDVTNIGAIELVFTPTA